MVKRLVSASAVSLALAVSGFTGALAIGGVTAGGPTLALGCAPTIQDPQCIIAPLFCHQRCAAPAVVASLPGDPCSRDCGYPVEEICHL